MIACGENHTVIQNEKNEVYVCGANWYGQLGLGDDENRCKFEKVEYDFGNIKKIACGGFHIVIQNEKNEVYVCGNNEFGQLGLSDNEHRDKFEKLEHNHASLKNIACGGDHTVIQNEKNEIYVYGQLDLGDNKNIDKFEKVKYNFGEIKNIACGGDHIVIQNEKNEIYVCGNNWYGQLGLGDHEDRDKFEKVKKNFGEIKNIICGFYHTVIQNKKGEIYVCGKNEFGQLGLGDNYNRNKFEKVECDLGLLKNVVCKGDYMVIQNEENEIYVCGYNGYGQLGLGDNKHRNRLEKVEKNFGEIENIACGGNHIVIRNEKNGIYACGGNYSGQLGLDDSENRNKFEKVDTNDMFEKIYKFELEINVENIAL